MSHPRTVTARWYTQTRRFPKYVGSINGAPIAIGPFQLPPMLAGQFVCGIVLVLVLIKTSSIWATGNIVANVVIAVTIAVGGTFLAGFLPWGGRSFFWIISGYLRQRTRLARGTIHQNTVVLPKPRRISGRVSLYIPPPSANKESAEIKPPQSTTEHHTSQDEATPHQPQKAPRVRELTPVALSLARTAKQRSYVA